MSTNSNIRLVLDPFLDFTKEFVPPPARDKQQYAVQGYQGGGFASNTKEGRSANCYLAVNQAVEVALKYVDKDFTWPKISILKVLPDAGKMWNAYYNRFALRFFHGMDTVRQHLVYASSAAKIVYHETGHGLLDSIRPDLWRYTNFEVWAYHEAFGDLVALFTTLQNDELLCPRNPLVISAIGVEFGDAIWGTPPGKHRPLRDAAIRFYYKDPKTLSPKGPDEELAAEPHSFSRVFSSAVYTLLFRMADQIKVTEKKNPIVSMREAVDTLGRYTITGASLAAVNENFFDSVARAMMFVDFREGKKHLSLMNDVFSEFGILKPASTAITKMEAAPPGYHVTKQEETLSLSNEIHIQSVNPLHKLKVEVARDRLTVGGDSQVHHLSESDRNAVLDDVALCLDYVHREGLVGGSDSPFAIQGDKLVRQHFACFPRK